MDNTIRLRTKDLGSMSSMSQGLDNQYVPLSGLAQMKRKKLARETFRADISKSISAEFKRSLLYTEKTIVNRAFLPNTVEIYGPLLSLGTEKESLVELFRSGSIIPYLYTEETVLDETDLSKSDAGKQALQILVQEAGQIPCIRFSWDKDQNIKYANNVAQAYTNYVISARIVAKKLAQDLRVKNVKAFENRLIDVTRFCTDVFQSTGKNFVTRRQLYEEFVCVDGKSKAEREQNVLLGRYDFDKPFWKELKLIFDLKYQANLTDALKIQTFSANDLPERNALHELDMIASGVISPEVIDLPALFSEVLYGRLAKGLWLSRIDELTYTDIFNLRKTDEHRRFVAASQQIKQDAQRSILDTQNPQPGRDVPIKFAEFYGAFLAFQNVIAQIPNKKSVENIQPKINLVLKLGAVLITIFADQPVLRIAGATNLLRDETAVLTAKLFAGAATDFDLSLNFDFMRTRIESARFEYNRILEHFEKAGFRIERDEQKSAPLATLSTEALDYPEM